MSKHKLDILVFAAHPDDAELGCSGTIMHHVAKGMKVGVVDLTEGELGTRGTVVDRYNEAADSSEILGLTVRENLKLRDGFFANDEKSQLTLIKIIRKYRPEIVICNALHDRHPDHGRSSQLESESCFLAGLKKIETFLGGQQQEAWRPKAVFHYIQDRYIKPDFIIDITPYWERKVKSIKAFKTQFHDPSSSEPETYISNKNFLHFIEGRALEFGHAIGARYGEGFTIERLPKVDNLFDII